MKMLKFPIVTHSSISGSSTWNHLEGLDTLSRISDSGLRSQVLLFRGPFVTTFLYTVLL